jgi:hypothetical protein
MEVRRTSENAQKAKFVERRKAEVRRISLLGTWANRRKAGAVRSPGTLAYDVALYATTSPAVTWGGFGLKEPRSSATNSPAL